MYTIETPDFVIEWCHKPGNRVYMRYFTKTATGLVFKWDNYYYRNGTMLQLPLLKKAA